MQTSPTLITHAFLYVFLIYFLMLQYHVRKMMAKQQPPKNLSSLLKVDCLEQTAEETTTQGDHHGQKNGKLSWLLCGCWTAFKDLSMTVYRENLLDVWFIWKIPPQMCRKTFSKIQLVAKEPLQKSISGSRTRAHRDWQEGTQSKDRQLVSGAGEKGKSVIRQKDNV